jgi:hypothetical protein
MKIDYSIIDSDFYSHQFRFRHKLYEFDHRLVSKGDLVSCFDTYSFDGILTIQQYTKTFLPIQFFNIYGELRIVDCPTINTLKNLVVNDLGGKVLVSMCPELDQREVKIINNRRLRRLWNSSNLDLDDFLLQQRGRLSSMKFGF